MEFYTFINKDYLPSWKSVSVAKITEIKETETSVHIKVEVEDHLMSMFATCLFSEGIQHGISIMGEYQREELRKMYAKQ